MNLQDYTPDQVNCMRDTVSSLLLSRIFDSYTRYLIRHSMTAKWSEDELGNALKALVEEDAISVLIGGIAVHPNAMTMLELKGHKMTLTDPDSYEEYEMVVNYLEAKPGEGFEDLLHRAGAKVDGTRN